MAFEIGPRENESTVEVPARGPNLYVEEHPPYRSELHARVINGTRYGFGRFTYEDGKVALQAVKLGESSRANPDVHYWTN
ncbi:hypothetical protein [Streptomyces sp. NPDC055793]